MSWAQNVIILAKLSTSQTQFITDSQQEGRIFGFSEKQTKYILFFLVGFEFAIPVCKAVDLQHGWRNQILNNDELKKLFVSNIKVTTFLLLNQHNDIIISAGI